MTSADSGTRTADRLLRGFREGALSAVAAVASMAAAAVVALSLLHAGSVGSLGSMTAAVLVMAVGSPVTFGSARSHSGLLHLKLSGGVGLMPLGLTLVGTVVLALLFFRPLRNRPPVSGVELAARAAGAVAVVPSVFAGLVVLARGTLAIPTKGLGGSGTCSAGPSTLLGGKGSVHGGLATLLGGLMDRLFGSGGINGALSSLSFRAALGPTVLGSLLWVVVVLAVGCMAARRTPLPPAITANRLRRSWGPVISALVSVVLVPTAVLVAVLAIAGLVVGGTGATAAGAGLLAVPNLVLVALPLGVGSVWTVTTGQAKTQSTLSSLLGHLQGSCGPSTHTQNLAHTHVGGVSLGSVALLLAGLTLLLCGAIAAARTPRPGTCAPDHAWYHRHLALAWRMGVVTALLMGTATTLVAASAHVAVTVLGTQLTGMQARLAASALQAIVLGLLGGAVAGFAGSLLHATLAATRGKPHHTADPVTQESSADRV